MIDRNHFLCGFAVLCVAAPAGAASYRLADVTVVAGKDTPSMVKLAAGEVRNYVYQLTGTWPPMAEAAPAGKPAIMLRCGPGGKVPAGGPAECGTKSFNWFSGRDGNPTVNPGPNLAGNDPVPERFPVLEAMAGDLLGRSRLAAKEGRPHAAAQ